MGFTSEDIMADTGPGGRGRVEDVWRNKKSISEKKRHPFKMATFTI